ncbi:MAG TPA: fibronectin type III domain-containing protein [Bacteroidales bacterium]|nr:fibronectin type III domain-containing protein [Bacteroidales bacterium]
MKTKSTFFLFLFVVLSISLRIQAAGLLSFPGAEGFGRFAVGGRGGSIYHVTNLNDSGTGSFRDAISVPNRIVVFDVSGVIKVAVGNPLIFQNNLTILGQTAPGMGIQIYGERVSFSGADNIIVRYLRIRMGIGGTSGKDAAGVANGSNMMFDHLSVLWGRDECFSVNWDGKGTEPANITIQNSIIGQGLQTHSCGGLIQTNGGVTLYRNLYIENKTRNPKVKGLNQYINNVVYNWGNGGCYIMGDTEANSWADIQNNYFINGPWDGATSAFSRGTPTFTVYGKGNFLDANLNGSLDGTLMTPDQYSGSTPITDFNTWDNSTTRPQAHPVVLGMKTAKDALTWIIDSVGPSLPARDDVDKYIIDEVKTYGGGTSGGITSERTLPHGGTGVLYGGYKPTDTDGDAIPDAWETANGLNPTDASDAAAIATNGYSNIENYSFTIGSAYPYIKSPSGLTSTAQSTSTIQLKWTDNSSDETGFFIESSTNGTTFSVIATVDANTTTYVNTGLSQVTKYYYRVSAFNTTLNSPYSAVYSTSTWGDPTIPVACSNPSPADAGSYGNANPLKLTWSNATTPYGGTLYYFVYMGPTADSLQLVADSITTPFFTYGMVPAGKHYVWRVDTRNTMGRTNGNVWSFETIIGGQLFSTDFRTNPAAFYTSYGSTGATTNIINASNTTKTVGGMTFGSGSNSIRIVYIPQGNPTSTTSEYGPFTAADSGSTTGCVQFYTPSSGGYLKFPEVQGPCVLTLWAGNPSTSSLTFNLNSIIGGVETRATSFNLAAAKRAFKLQYTYLGTDKIIFKVDANAKKFNLNDALIESFVPLVSEDPIAITSFPDTSNINYMDGPLTLNFNQTIRYNGGILINGDQFEQVSATGGGTSIQVNYTGLDANTEYILQFPEGSITDFYNTKSFTNEFSFRTSDFLPSKITGDTHFGKAAISLPLTFKPFNVVSPFTTVGSLTQTSTGDFPHWITAAGGITADSVLMTSTSDKMMCYFNDQAKKLRIKANMIGTGTVTLKVQESRNPDGTPGWRTIRQLTQANFPLDMEFYLNPLSQFVKIVPVSISGTMVVKEIQLTDAIGTYTGLSEKITDLGVRTVSASGRLSLRGLSSGMELQVYDAMGRTILLKTAQGESQDLELQRGFYILKIKEGHSLQNLKAYVL